MHRAASIGCLLLLLTSACLPAYAQMQRPRIGFGLTATMTTDSTNPLGPGLHVRGAMPINSDLSFALGTGIAGFVLGGREEAAYYATPQLTAIVTLNSTNARSPYVLFGVGGYMPIGDNTNKDDGGPTLIGGIGWAVTLQQTSIYFEVNPSLVVAKKAARLVMPINLGVVL